MPLLTIRDEQIQAMQVAREEAYRTKLIQWLTEAAPRLERPDADAEEITSVADHALTTCKRHGIRGEADIATFAGRTLKHGIGFENLSQHRVVGDVLNDQGVPGEDKMATIRRRERAAQRRGGNGSQRVGMAGSGGRGG